MKRLIPLLAFMILVSCMGDMKGIISVKGNEPHTYVAFTMENGDVYMVEGPRVNELREKYQGAKVKVKCKLIKEKSGIAPGIIEITEVYKD